MSEMDNQVSSHSIWKILVILTAVGVFVVMISFNGLAGAGGNGKIYLTLYIINGLAVAGGNGKIYLTLTD